jgi:hypothetical protein
MFCSGWRGFFSRCRTDDGSGTRRGASYLRDFCTEDSTTFRTDMAYLTGVAYGGVAGNKLIL